MYIKPVARKKNPAYLKSSQTLVLFRNLLSSHSGLQNLIAIIFFALPCLLVTGICGAAPQNITLLWTESIDAPYLASYRVYYYTASGNPSSLQAADYATSYTLAGGTPVSINAATAPKPITISKINTQITLHFADDSKPYYFVVTAIDTRGLESVPTAEVSSAAASPDVIVINGGAAATNNRTVIISLAAAGAVQMQFSNDGVTWSTAETYAATKSWTLSTGDGQKTVYAKFRNSAGVWSTPYTDTIALDATAPVTTATPAQGTYTAAQNVTLKANEQATIYYTTNGATPTTSSTVYSAPVAVSTTTTLKFFARDAVGNSEAVKSLTYTITSSNSPPTGTVNINSGAARTKSTAVTLTLSATDSDGVSQMQFSNDGATWSTAQTYATSRSWTLAAGDGTKTVYAKFKDSRGNWSKAYADTIILDRTAPATTANPAGGTYQYKVAVTLSANESATIYYTTNGRTPTTSSTRYGSPISITSSKTLKYFARDAAGNSEAVKSQYYRISRYSSRYTSSAETTAYSMTGTPADSTSSPSLMSDATLSNSTLSAAPEDGTTSASAEEKPIILSGTVTQGNIPGLAVVIVGKDGTAVGSSPVEADGTWNSQLLPAGEYTWRLVYGNRVSDANAATFDTTKLKSIRGKISGLPEGGGVLLVKSESGIIQKTVNVRADGYYSVDNLVPANDYEVSLVARNKNDSKKKTSVSETARVDLSASNANDIDFNLNAR